MDKPSINGLYKFSKYAMCLTLHRDSTPSPRLYAKNPIPIGNGFIVLEKATYSSLILLRSNLKQWYCYI